MTGREWIDQFAALLGVPAPDAAAFDALLALAGTAAHGSERIAAPIACYLVGLAGRDLTEARALAERVSVAEA
jgi:hypothetical protein